MDSADSNKSLRFKETGPWYENQIMGMPNVIYLFLWKDNYVHYFKKEEFDIDGLEQI